MTRELGSARPIALTLAFVAMLALAVAAWGLGHTDVAIWLAVLAGAFAFAVLIDAMASATQRRNDAAADQWGSPS